MKLLTIKTQEPDGYTKTITIRLTNKDHRKLRQRFNTNSARVEETAYKIFYRIPLACICDTYEKTFTGVALNCGKCPFAQFLTLSKLGCIHLMIDLLGPIPLGLYFSRNDIYWVEDSISHSKCRAYLDKILWVVNTAIDI